MFKKWRLKAGYMKLKNELKKLNVIHHSISLNKANKIGILFTVNNEKEMQEAEDFALELQKENKQVKLLGLLLNKELHVLQKSNIEYIKKDDLDWDYIPKKIKITQFLSNEFDILINLCTDFCFPLVYLTAVSKAIFRVGAYQKEYACAFDFMVETEQHSLKNFSTEIKHYLEKIQ